MPVVGGDVDVLLLCADMNALDKFIKAHPELSKPIMEICSVPIEDRLLTVPFLREISKSKLSVLAAMCRYEAFESNRVVFEQDSVADKLFLVLSGVAQVIAKPEQVVAESSTHKSSPLEQAMTLRRTLECSSSEMRFSQIERERRNEPLIIAELKSGDYFGETALVFNIDRTCGVRTIEVSLLDGTQDRL
jgi:CRP-like cAMP-binding protein